MNRIVITGGMGFIGSYLAEEFLRQDETCEAICLLDTSQGIPYRNSSVAHDARVLPVLCDVGDALAFRKVLAEFRPTHIIHAAALLGVQNVVRGPRITLESNFLGTLNVLQSIVAEARGIKKFVYFSTSEIFGSRGSFLHETLNGVIGPFNDPRWSYSVSKLAGEHLTYGYHKEFGIPSVIVRPFNIYGPRRVGDYAVLRFVEAALKNKPVCIHGTGQQIRSWCFVTDFARCVVAATLRLDDGCADYNVGNPVSTISIYELARSIVRLAGSTSELVHVDPHISDIDVRIPSIDKAAKAFGYWPEVDLESGLTQTLQWWRAHLDLLPNFEDYPDVQSHPIDSPTAHRITSVPLSVAR